MIPFPTTHAPAKTPLIYHHLARVFSWFPVSDEPLLWGAYFDSRRPRLR